MKREPEPEGPTADEIEKLMAAQRRRLKAWTQAPSTTKPAEAEPKAAG